MNEITIENIKEKLKPFFNKFPPLQNNYCSNCLGDLKEVQEYNEDKDK